MPAADANKRANRQAVKRVAAKRRASAPASRSDAAQRRGARTPKPKPVPTSPVVKPFVKARDTLEKLNNAAARDRIRHDLKKSGPPTPVERASEKHDADLTQGRAKNRYERKQRKITEQALKDLFKARSQRRQSRGRETLRRQGFLPQLEDIQHIESKDIKYRERPVGRGRSGIKDPYIDGKRVYIKDGKVLDARPKTKLENLVEHAAKDTLKYLGGGNQKTAGFDINPNGAVKRAISKGMIAGGKSALGAVGSALDRPSAAVEAAIGKTAEKVGIIKSNSPGSAGKKIQHARGPLAALVKGRRHGKDITGGTLVKGFGGPEQAGIVVDLATDPLMYLGVGALPKAAAARAAALTKRIERAGTEARTALHSEKLASAASRARRTGDSDQLLAILEDIADTHGVSKRALGRSKAERTAKRQAVREQRADRVDETRQVLEDIRAGRAAQVGEVGGKGRRKPAGTYVPDVAGMKAVESVAKHAKQSEVRPGFRLRLLAPTGRELGHVPVPLPKRLANAKIVPVASKRGRDALRTLRLQDARYEEAVPHRAALDEVAKQRRTQSAVGNAAALDALDSMEKNLTASMTKRLGEKSRRIAADTREAMLQSPQELATRANRRRMLRTVAPNANEFGRMAQEQFQSKVMKSLEDAFGSPTKRGVGDHLARIQLHRWARADTGSQSVLKKAGIKLTPKERQVMKELDAIDAQMAKFGLSTGTLNRVLEDYGGPRIWANGEDGEEIVKNMSARMGTGSFFSKHRSHAAVSDLADPDQLAAEIKRLSGRELTDEQARALADEWHQTGAVRNAQEMMLRSVQRGNDTLDMDTLPGLFQRAARLGETMTPRGQSNPVPLFELDQPMSPGIVRQARSERAMQEYGLPSLHPGEMTIEQQLTSALADRDRLRHILRTTKSGTKTWRDQKKFIKRLDNEINALRREQALERVDSFDNAIDEASVLDDLTQTEQRLWAVAQGMPEGPEKDQLVNQLMELQTRIARQKEAMNNRAISDSEFELEHFEDPQFENFTPIPGQRADLESEIDRILDDPKSGNPFDDIVDDVTSRLPDFRESGMFPILDMRKSYFYRTRSEGVNAAFRARWKGIDAAEGRSVDEAQALYRAADGTEGKVADLERWEMPPARTPEQVELQQREAQLSEILDNTIPEGKEYLELEAQLAATEKKLKELQQGSTEQNPVVWYDRAQDRVFNEDELQSTPAALVPNHDRTLFWDLHTGREYTFPHLASAGVGESISRTIQPLTRDGGQYSGRVWPTDVIHAADIEAKRGGDYDIVFKTGMEGLVRQTLSLSRYSVTSLFPAYHVRNMISDTLKSLQADSGVLFHPIANAKLAAMAFGMNKGRTITIKGLGEMKTEDFLLMADAFGIRSGHHVAEVARLADTGQFPERSVGGRAVRALGPSGAVGKKAVDFGVAREDVTRFLTFAQRMRTNGGDAADAMLHMIRHHFDYNDLTIRERRNIRNLFLFYTWYRKNIPLQLVELAHRPGFFAGVAHSYNALEQGETPINQDWQKLNPMFPDLSGKMPKRGTMPDYLKDRLSSVGLNWNGHAAMFGFGAPWADLALLKVSPEGLRDFAAMMNPAITTGYQIAAQEDLLTGRDFSQQETSGAANAIDIVIDALGLGELPKDEKGRPVLPWAATVALRNLVPGLGRSFGTFDVSPPTRDPGRLQTYGKRLNALHGINVYVAPEPGSKREELAISNRVKGRAAERRQLNEQTYNLPDSVRERLIQNFDKETLRWLRDHDIPKRYLYTTKQSGFYRAKPRRKAGSGLGGGGGLGGSLGGGSLGD